MTITTLDIVDGEYELRTHYGNKDRCKNIPGYRYDRTRQAWRYPATPMSSEELAREFPNAEHSEEADLTMRTDAVTRTLVNKYKAEPLDKTFTRFDPPVTTELFSHQKTGFNLGMCLPNIAYLLEMGVGKTLTAISVAGRRYLDGNLQRVLIVAPASVVGVWPKEFTKFSDIPVDVIALQGNTKKRAQMLESMESPNSLQVVVTNYESVWRKGFFEALSDWIAEYPTLVICDESQRIKTANSAQSKAMHKLGELADFRMILTGTPVTNHPVDFYSQYKFLDPTIFGKSVTTFRNKYVVFGGFEGREIIAYKNIEDLERRAMSIAYRVTKDECLDLPPVTPVTRYCELEPAAKRLYKALKKEYFTELESGSEVTTTNVLTKLLRLQQITGGHITDDNGKTTRVSDAKLKLLSETLGDSLANDEKVVVFARFRAEIEDITRMLYADGIQFGLIWGDTPMRERDQIIEDFQTDPSIKVFVAQIQTAGLGITLTAASVAIFYSLDFNYANYTQALSRIDRFGQTKPVTNIHLIASGTVDESVMGALDRKQNVADCVVDGGWRNVIEGRDVVRVDAFNRLAQ